MMKLSDEVAQHLPYLRRYARAIAGSQDGGDSWVKAGLTALLQRGELRGGTGDDLRVRLFHALHAVRHDAGVPGAGPAGGAAAHTGTTALASRIDTLRTVEREVLVLAMLEGFTLQQVAVILGLDAREVRRLHAEAREKLKAQEATRILIIEDEPVIALDIAEIVKEYGHTIVGIASTRREAVAIASEADPGLVLADIQLADDSSGIDAAMDIVAEHPVPVVFITAFPERLLTGERPEPAFLITKPFDPDTLSVTISQALAARSSASAA